MNDWCGRQLTCSHYHPPLEVGIVEWMYQFQDLRLSSVVVLPVVDGGAMTARKVAPLLVFYHSFA